MPRYRSRLVHRRVSASGLRVALAAATELVEHRGRVSAFPGSVVTVKASIRMANGAWRSRFGRIAIAWWERADQTG